MCTQQLENTQSSQTHMEHLKTNDHPETLKKSSTNFQFNHNTITLERTKLGMLDFSLNSWKHKTDF